MRFVKKEYWRDVCLSCSNLFFVLLIVSCLFEILWDRLLVKVIFLRLVVCLWIWINFVLVWLFNEKIIVVDVIKLYVLCKL